MLSNVDPKAQSNNYDNTTTQRTLGTNKISRSSIEKGLEHTSQPSQTVTSSIFQRHYELPKSLVNQIVNITKDRERNEEMLRASYASGLVHNSPNRLTMRQAAHLQKMANNQGISNFDVTDRYELLDKSFKRKDQSNNALYKHSSVQHMTKIFTARKDSDTQRDNSQDSQLDLP